jgi:hypothetical protein
MDSLRQEWRYLRDLVSGRAERQRLVGELVHKVVLSIVHEIRRDYLERPKSDDPDPAYERGYGDAVLDMTHRMEKAIQGT